MLWEIYSLSRKQLKKLYPLSICLICHCEEKAQICLKEIPPLLFPVKTSLFTAWPEQAVQPVSLRWLMIRVSLAGNLQQGKLCPTVDGREGTLITTGERKKRRVNQTEFGCLLRDAPCKEILSSYWCFHKADVFVRLQESQKLLGKLPCFHFQELITQNALSKNILNSFFFIS